MYLRNPVVEECTYTFYKNNIGRLSPAFFYLKLVSYDKV